MGIPALAHHSVCPGRDEQRSLVTLAPVVRESARSLLEALAGDRSLLSALNSIQRRMRSGCQMNQRKNHPNAAHLLQRCSTNWALSPSVGAYGEKNVGTPQWKENQNWREARSLGQEHLRQAPLDAWRGEMREADMKCKVMW